MSVVLATISHRASYPRLLGLDLLRLFAALSVLVFHAAYWPWPVRGAGRGGLAVYPELVGLSWWGFAGVEIFFVVSGFVIAYSASRASPASFVRGRVLRLLPAAIACATVSALVAAALGLNRPLTLLLRWLSSILFNPLGPWVEPSYWTLGIEVAFYSLVFALLAAKRFRWIEGVMVVVAAVSAGVWVWRLLVELGLGLPQLPPIRNRALELLLVPHGVYFATGALIWLGLFGRWTWGRTVWLLVAMAGGYLGLYMNARDVLADGLQQTRHLPPLIWAGAVFVMVASVRLDGALQRFVSPPLAGVIRTIGLLTYPLYLLNYTVGTAFLVLLLRLGFERYMALTMTIVSLVALAALITVAVEPALRRLVGHLLDRAPVLRSPEVTAHPPKVTPN